MEKVVFGLIGAGGIAQSQHLSNLTRAPHVYLKSVCDLNEQTLSQVQKDYDISETFTDYKKLLDDPEIQAVLIATREDTHAQITIEALEAGKHVYVEKPLAVSEQQCREVAEAQKKSDKFVAVGFNRRFAPAYLKAKEIITSKGGAKNLFYRIADHYYLWGACLPPGTRVIHEVCHIFDIIRWLTDSDVESIYCVDSRPDDEVIVMKMKSGCVATILDSGYVTKDMPKENLEVITEIGAVTVLDFVELRTFGYPDREAVYRYPGHTHLLKSYTHKYLLEKLGSDALYALRKMAWEFERQVEDPDQNDRPDRIELERFVKEQSLRSYMVDKGWLAAVDHLAECIITGKTPRNATAVDGLNANILSHAAIKSRESGQVIRF